MAGRKRTAPPDVEESSVAGSSRGRPRRVTFRQKSNIFDPSRALLVSNTKAGHIKIEDATDNMLQFLNNEEVLLTEMDNVEELEPIYAMDKRDNTHHFSKIKSTGSRTIAEFHIPFDPFKLTTIVLPNGARPQLQSSRSSSPSSVAVATPRMNRRRSTRLTQTMMAVSAPAGGLRESTFIYDNAEYAWKRSAYGYNLQKSTDAGIQLCAKWLGKRTKHRAGLLVIDEDKADERVVLVTLMVCLKREDSIRGRVASAVSRWSDR